MAPTLYSVYLSPPVRAVLITAKALGLTLNEKVISITNKEHLSPKYLKLNPQHTVPTFVDDDGFVVWDSHAIIYYLVTKYGKNSTLLPTDPKLRAVVEQRLHFDSGVLFNLLQRAIMPLMNGMTNSLAEEDIASLKEAYGFLESFLDGKQWIAGDDLTIADYSLISTVTSANAVLAINEQQFPKVMKWIAKMKTLPEYAANEKGLQRVTEIVASLTNHALILPYYHLQLRQKCRQCLLLVWFSTLEWIITGCLTI